MLRKMVIALALVLLMGTGAHAASDPVPSPAAGREVIAPTAMVRVDGVALFPVRGISSHPAAERAAAIAGRIAAIASDPTVKIDSIVIVEADHSTDIVAGDRHIVSLFDLDAALEGINRHVLAKAYLGKIKMAVETYRQDRATGRILRGSGSALGVTLLFIGAILLIRRIFRRLLLTAESKYTAKIRELQEKSHDIVRTEGVWTAIRGGLIVVRVVLILIITFFYIELVMRLFPWTRTYAIPLFEMILSPLSDMGAAVLEYLPKLIFLVILVIIARYGLGVLKTFFIGIQRGTITISGFDAMWAMPTYKLARLAAIAFTVVVAYPYIPGSESPAFKGVSLFLGVVFSLGSSASVSNIVAGYMVIFRRAYKVGDRVKIGQHAGDVTEMRLQVTHLRTIKNEEIIVPNSLIMNTEVINYSSLARKGGLILHTSVTIGYDTPWRQVHAMLILAAERTSGLLKEPHPFVLQNALNDFYVSYELNAYTDRPLETASIYSELHQNIQDAFNEFGVQIMSPHYLGDPAQAKIVPKEQWYQAPAKEEPKTGPAGKGTDRK